MSVVLNTVTNCDLGHPAAQDTPTKDIPPYHFHHKKRSLTELDKHRPPSNSVATYRHYGLSNFLTRDPLEIKHILYVFDRSGVIKR